MRAALGTKLGRFHEVSRSQTINRTNPMVGDQSYMLINLTPYFFCLPLTPPTGIYVPPTRPHFPPFHCFARGKCVDSLLSLTI